MKPVLILLKNARLIGAIASNHGLFAARQENGFRGRIFCFFSAFLFFFSLFIVNLNWAHAATAQEKELVRLCRDAGAALESHRYEEASRLADAMLKIDPRNSYSTYLKARSLFLEHHAEEALPVYERLMTMGPAPNLKLTAYDDMAVCASDLNQLDRALKYLDLALAIRPDAYSYKLKGQIYRLRHDEPKASDCLRKSVELSPKDYWSIKELTHSYMVQKRYAEALKTSNEMVRLRPGEPDSYNSRARVYEKLGQTANARKDFEEAKKRTDEFAF